MRIGATLSLGWLFLSLLRADLRATDVIAAIEAPMTPPYWALLQRELLRANTAACEEFFAKYFDERGYLLCVERWGGDDGPDDAIENVADWPILPALGAPDVVLQMYKKAWEGHLRQYTEARTVEVPFARGGMYYKEFPCMMDWMHNGEGLRVFNLQGLSDPYDVSFGHRVRRFAGFYMNEDPGAPNYDPEHRIIRSLLNGSRGPLLRRLRRTPNARNTKAPTTPLSPQPRAPRGSNRPARRRRSLTVWSTLDRDGPSAPASPLAAASATSQR